jgi:MFS transporter, DHA1 family, multidrug resistance protein
MLKKGDQIIFMSPGTLKHPAWRRTLYIMFIVQVMSSVGFSSIFPFLPLYVQTLGSRWGLSIELLAGLVYSAQAFSMMLSSPLWGSVADRFGRKLMVERANYSGTIILLLMAFAGSAEMLVFLRLIQGAVTGTVAAANALVAAEAPRDRTGYAMGLIQVGTGAGIAIGPLIGGTVADLWGYNAAFYVTSGMLFISGVLVSLFIKEDFNPTRHKSRKNGKPLNKWKEILSGKSVLTVYSLRFTSYLGSMMIIPIAPLFIQTLLENQEQLNTFTGLVIGVSYGAVTISGVYLGRLGDRIGHRKVFTGACLGAFLLYLPQTFVTAGWQLLLLQALTGLALGGVVPSLSALLARLTSPGYEGAVYGLDNSIISGSRTIAPLISSMIAASLGLRAVFPTVGALFLFAAIMALVRLRGDAIPPAKNEEGEISSSL